MSFLGKTAHRQILDAAAQEIEGLVGNTLDILEITKPPDIVYAAHLAKVISKLSPLIGNMIEFSITNILNAKKWDYNGHWIRQDPGFPDILFKSGLSPEPGIEIKTWFPLSTEITARFKDSISHFSDNQTDVVMIAWIPEFLIYGKPKMIGAWRDTAKSLARTRDNHYHRPPHYLVFEPQDTRSRTANLQQTNTNGYVFQGTERELEEAEREVRLWGSAGILYDFSPPYQLKLRQLRNKYNYRLDTNFAKMDRIAHSGLEEFKSEILALEMFGHTLLEWGRRGFFKTEKALTAIL